MPTLDETIISNWLPAFDKHVLVAPLRAHIDRNLQVGRNIKKHREELAADKSLSDFGRRDKLQPILTAEAKAVAAAKRDIDHTRKMLRERQVGLTPTVKDKTDVASALLRQEIRAVFRNQDSSTDAFAKAMAVSNEAVVLEALFEGPPFLSNISPEQRDTLLDTVIKRNHGPVVSALREQLAAVNVVESSLTAAKTELGQAAEVPENRFDQWLSEVAPITGEEAATEANHLLTQALSREGLNLPFKDRHALIDLLLDRQGADVAARSPAA